MSSSIILLLSYTLFWVIVFFSYYRKHRRLDSIAVFYVSLIFYAVCSFVLYFDDTFSFRPLKLFPFVYLCAALYLTSLPLRQFSISDFQRISLPSKEVIYALIIIPTLCGIINLPNLVNNFSSGLLGLFKDSSIVYDSYMAGRDLTESTGSGISDIVSIFQYAFAYINTLLLFVVLLHPNRNKLMIFGVCLSIITSIIQSVSSGERGGVFQVVICLIGTYFLLRNWLDKKTQRIMKIISIVFVSFIVLTVAYMTIGRFSNTQEGALKYTVYYLGQQNLYFNNYALDDNGIRYGDRTIPLFKKMIGVSNVPNNFIERRSKYPSLYINDEVFSTYVGDFAIDFGPWGAALLMIIITLWILKITRARNGTIHLNQIIFVHFVLCMCMTGALELFQFSDTSGNLSIIVYLIAAFITSSSRNQILIYR